MRDTILNALQKTRGAKRPVALVTHMPSGDQILIDAGAIDSATIKVRSGDAGGAWPDDGELLAAAARVLGDDKSARYPDQTGELFVQAFNPPKRLIVVGAVHIAQKLVPMAELADFEVTIIDPRGTFATEARFSGADLVTDWPDEAPTALGPDTRTAVVTLTHDPKLDDPALTVALRSEAFYIGSLGSRKTHAARLERLRAVGFSEIECARIHGPVGLALGAKSPAEIALSILAQITRTLHAIKPEKIDGAGS